MFPHRHNTYEIRSEEHTSELQSQDGISYAVFCLRQISGNCSMVDCRAERHSSLLIIFAARMKISKIKVTIQ